MKILIRTECTAIRKWHCVLSDELKIRFPDSLVSIVPASGAPKLPGGVTALLELERLVLRRSTSSIWDVADGASFSEIPVENADFVLDCSGLADCDPAPAGVTLLRPLYDGSPAIEALLGALLSGRMPVVSIQNAGTGTVVASGRPSTETAQGLRAGAEAALSRVIPLFSRAIATPEPVPNAAGAQPRAPYSVSKYTVSELKNLAIGAIYRLCFYAPHWRIGWRLVEGPGVMDRFDLEGPRWRVLNCPPTSFAADPFPMVWKGKAAILFELLDHRHGKGIIAGVNVGPGGPQGDVFPVIEEPYHLSYPFMFEENGELWMIPESSLSGSVPIYRCIEFPHRWERHATLIENAELADCTIFKHEGTYWMTSVERHGYGGYSDMLVIHYAANLFGPWHEHKLQPVMVDIAHARPAGNVVMRDGVLLRPFQDCEHGYGHTLGIARIDHLSPDDFRQTVVARVSSGPLWPGNRIHTVSRADNIECIDGRSYNPKIGVLRPLFKTMDDP